MPGVAVADVPGELHGVGADPVAQLRVEVRRGGELDDLLVAALHGAVPLEEVDDLALPVGEDLHLDVAGLDDGLLQEHRGVAERGGGLPGRGLDGLPQLGGVLHAAHAPAAAARDRLHEHGEADLAGRAHQFVDVGGGRGGAEDGDARLPGGGHRAGLVAGQLQDPGVGSDEGDARVRAGLGQLGVLRQEPVARVDGVGARPARRADDLLDGQIGPDRVSRFADLVGLVGLQTVQRVAVLVREDGDGARTEFVARAERPDRDLAAVGDEHLAEHGRSLQPAGDDHHRVRGRGGTPCEPGHSSRARRGHAPSYRDVREGATGGTFPLWPPAPGGASVRAACYSVTFSSLLGVPVLGLLIASAVAPSVSALATAAGSASGWPAR